MLELNTLYNMDCMDGMSQFPDKYFDLAIVDPPYFKDYGKENYPGSEISTTGIKRNLFASSHWDVPDHEYFKELIRVSKDQIIWGENYYPEMPFLGTGRIIWDKKNDLSSFSKCEIAYCSLHNRTEIFRYLWNGMLQENMREKEKRIHPTQKPVALYKWLLNKYAKQGDKILDTHVGSASSLIACFQLGFDYVGFEIDKDYYESAQTRLHEAMLQPSMLKQGDF
jgi:site-specific DNA-methyltransferase (adenine-specific)